MMKSLRALSIKDMDIRISRGRFSEEDNFQIFLRGKETAHGKHFRGRASYRPWIEVSIALKHREKILKILCDFLPPGSHIMVGYSNDKETRDGLRKGIPEAATPLGFILWKCGCRWFKDWYFAEGFKEGGIKLQGEKPLNPEQKRKLEEKTREQLRKFLDMESKGKMISGAKTRAKKLLG